MERLACILVIASAACERPPQISCAEVGSRAASVLSVLAPDDVTARTRVRDAIARQCSADAWSVETRACMIEIRSVEEAVACRSLFTEAQAVALSRTFEELGRDVMRELEATRKQVVKPSDEESAEHVSRSLVFELELDGGLKSSGTAITEAQLENLLRDTAARDPRTQVIVRARPGVPHGRVVKLMERTKAHGFTRLAIDSY
jgi:hypothetical protein